MPDNHAEIDEIIHLRKVFASRLIFLRKEAGLSQEELAEKLNINQNQISKFENAKSMPRWDNIVKIREIFDCSYDFLFSDYIPSERRYIEAVQKISATPPKPPKDLEIPDDKAEKIISIIEKVVSEIIKNDAK